MEEFSHLSHGELGGHVLAGWVVYTLCILSWPPSGNLSSFSEGLFLWGGLILGNTYQDNCIFFLVTMCFLFLGRCGVKLSIGCKLSTFGDPGLGCVGGNWATGAH